jgi:hypothetical protein
MDVNEAVIRKAITCMKAAVRQRSIAFQAGLNIAGRCHNRRYELLHRHHGYLGQMLATVEFCACGEVPAELKCGLFGKSWPSRE